MGNSNLKDHYSKNLNLGEILRRYNNAYMTSGNIYRQIAKNFGMSECTMWILYTLREQDCLKTAYNGAESDSERQVYYTQSMLCDEIHISKQTVNSALKKLETDGYVQLHSVAGNRKNKRVVLSDKGLELAKRTVDKIFEMEMEAFSLLESESLLYLELTERYVEMLHQEMQRQEIEHQEN